MFAQALVSPLYKPAQHLYLVLIYSFILAFLCLHFFLYLTIITQATSLRSCNTQRETTYEYIVPAQQLIAYLRDLSQRTLAKYHTWCRVPSFFDSHRSRRDLLSDFRRGTRHLTSTSAPSRPAQLNQRGSSRPQLALSKTPEPLTSKSNVESSTSAEYEISNSSS